MLNLSEFGILISAIGGVIVIHEKFSQKKDKYVIRFGHYHPEMSDKDAMFIVSKSYHSISIRDYGFVMENGELDSLPWARECASESDNYDFEQNGRSKDMKFNQVVEFKYRTSEILIGAFAISATQNFPRVSFARKVSYLQRLLLYLKILWRHSFPT